jgi:outer membrane protein assembly factor BamD
LDQLETEQAIEEFQLFMDRYPASAFRDSSQVMVNELRNKLEVKSFESAYTYYHTENYKSAVIAFKNALKEYPDTPFREQMQWLIVDSYFQYAELSTERRKLERYNDTIEAFLTFVARYPESQYMEQVQNVHDRCVTAIDNLAANLPTE